MTTLGSTLPEQLALYKIYELCFVEYVRDFVSNYKRKHPEAKSSEEAKDLNGIDCDYSFKIQPHAKKAIKDAKKNNVYDNNIYDRINEITSLF